MTHPRKQIRDKVVNALIGETAAGSNVYSNRSLRYWDTELPALNVTSATEASEKFSDQPREYKRALNLQIEARVEETDDIDDVQDALAKQIEQAVELEFFVTAPFFGLDFVVDLELSGTTFESSSDGEETIALLTLTYQIAYNSEVPLTAPDSIDDLDEVDVDYEMQEIVATDIIDELQS